MTDDKCFEEEIIKNQKELLVERIEKIVKEVDDNRLNILTNFSFKILKFNVFLVTDRPQLIIKGQVNQKLFAEGKIDPQTIGLKKVYCSFDKLKYELENNDKQKILSSLDLTDNKNLNNFLGMFGGCHLGNIEEILSNIQPKINKENIFLIEFSPGPQIQFKADWQSNIILCFLLSLFIIAVISFVKKIWDYCQFIYNAVMDSKKNDK